jgi:Calcineurin-like phosphoesterase
VQAIVRLGLVTDIHLAPLPQAPARWHNEYDFKGVQGRLEACMETFSDRGVNAVAVLGDLTNGGDAASLDAVLGTLGDAGRPVLVVPGNHDCEVDAAQLERAVRRSGGRVELAEAMPKPVAGTPVAGVALAAGGFGAAGLPDLAGPATVLLSHFPTVSRRREVTGAGFKYAGDLANLDRLEAHLGASPAPVVALSGHLHVRDAACHGAVLQILVPALIEPPYECAVLELGGDPLTVGYEAIAVAGTPDGLGVPLLSPASGRWVMGAQGWS